MYFVSLVEVLWSDGCRMFCEQVKIKCLCCGILNIEVLSM